jgi:hypothetical protein
MLGLFVLSALAHVPVVICDKPDPSAGAPLPPGTSIRVPLPESIARRLAAYWLSSGNAFLAPRGLACEGGVGSDGSESLTVGQRRQGRLDPVLVISSEFGCEGCKTTDSACFFRRARREAAHEYDYHARCPVPPAERRIAVGRHILLFEDPPGVRGSGHGSGGPLRSHGVAFLDAVSGNATCTLDDKDKPLCTAMLNQFIQVERAANADYLR